MTQDRIRWGILGTGAIATKFAGDLPASRTGRLVAVGSRAVDTAEEFGRKHGADRWYGDYTELLADDEVDAVYIATPHPMHARWAIRAAAAGKHVLCEKPLTLNHAEAMAVAEAAREHDVFCMEAYMYLCHPQTAAVAEIVRSGEIGELRQIQASFGYHAPLDPTRRTHNHDLAGGGILDVGGYPVSLAQFLAGTAHGTGFAEPVEVIGGGHVGDETRVDEWAVATLRFADGVVAQVSTGVRLAAPNTATVYGTKGYVVLPTPWLPGRSGESTTIEVHRVGQQPEKREFPGGALYAYEADMVADHLAEREAPVITLRDSLALARTMDKWRAGVGLLYDSELPDAAIPTVHGGPLTPASRGTMPRGTIGGLDKKMSRLVLGVDNQTTLPHASVMFDDFVERGGNAFDTAYIYGRGRCERLLGQWIRNRGIRDDVVVIGKGAHTPNCDPESLTRQLHESLERLQTDHVDIYFMHRDNPQVPVGEFVDVLDEHHRAGRIRAYGGSNWSLERVEEANAYAATHGRTPFAAVSNNFSLARALDVPWAGCLSVSDDRSRQWLEEHQLALMPWSSQARGFFSGRARPDDRSDEELVRCWYSDDNFERLARARELAERRGVDPTAIALAYVLHQDFPTFPLFGPRSLAETRSSVAGLSVELTPEEVRWLDLR